MNEQLNVVCGADIHQRFLVATILCRDGRKWTKRFLMNVNGLLDFKAWLMSYGCQKVAVESTGRFWIPVHMILDGTVACQFCCKIAVISSAKNRLAVNEITASYFLARYDN